MKVQSTHIRNLQLVVLDPLRDERGYFARTFCRHEFSQHDMKVDFVQSNTSFNRSRGTLRGMHFQAVPATEVKFVRCTRGAIWDAVIDLRPESPTFFQHFAVELTADNLKCLYVPERFAHGYQTLSDNSEVSYNVTASYSKDHERGLRFDDPTLALHWPLPVNYISNRDRDWPLMNDQRIALLRTELAL